MRALLIAAAALLLAACTVPTPQPLTSAPAAPVLIAEATLAVNACQAQTAPVYTQAIVATRAAEVALRRGQIAVATAERVLALSRAVRAELDSACADPSRADPQRLQRARAAVAEMQSLTGA